MACLGSLWIEALSEIGISSVSQALELVYPPLRELRALCSDQTGISADQR